MKKLLTISCTFVFLLGLSSAKDSGPEQAQLLLEQVEALAVDVREDAARLRFRYRFPSMHSWQVHRAELSEMAGHTERIGNFLDDFADIKDQALPRQNKAFNLIVQDSAKVSDLIDEAAAIVSEKKSLMEESVNPDYHDKIQEIYERTDKIAASVDLAESRFEVKQASEKVQSGE